MTRRHIPLSALSALCLAALLAACGVPGVSQATATPPPTATPIPTATLAPTNTPLPPTNTPVPPTNTPVPPTNTPPPPTATRTPTPLLTATIAAAAGIPTATAQPTVGQGGLPPTPTTVAAQPQPTGQIPAGWQVYRGTRVPFVMAYPPGWTVDESGVGEGLVYFRHPSNVATWLLVATTGQRETRSADELRDVYYNEQFVDCRAKAIDITRDNEFSGITFKSVGTTCDLADGLYYSYIGLGLRGGVPWRFRLNSPYAQYSRNSCRCDAGNVEQFFSPMLSSLNIYANP